MMQAQTRTTSRFVHRATLVLFAAWTLLQMISAARFGRDEPSIILLFAKVAIGPGSLLIVWVLTGFRLYHNPGLRLLLAFSVFCSLNTLAREEPHYQLSAMYMLWGFCMCIVVPAALVSRRAIVGFLKTNVFLILLVIGYIFVVAEWENLLWRGGSERLRYGFTMHPGYFSNVAAALFVDSVALFYLCSGRRRKVFYALSAVVAVLLIVLTGSRTYLVFTAVFCVVFLIQHSGVRRYLSVLSIVGLVAFIIVTYRGVFDGYDQRSTIDQISSGRISLWSESISSTDLTGSGMVMLRGQGRTIDRGGRAWSDTTTAKGAYANLHVDNVYLDILVQNGLVGLLLLLAAFIAFYLSLSRCSLVDKEDLFLARIARAAIAAMLMASFTDSFLPSFGNVLMSATFPFVVSIVAAFPSYRQHR